MCVSLCVCVCMYVCVCVCVCVCVGVIYVFRLFSYYSILSVYYDYDLWFESRRFVYMYMIRTTAGSYIIGHGGRFILLSIRTRHAKN